MKLSECNSATQIQHEFDIIQGKFGREGFSQRHSPVYIYLCSLVANYPNQELSNEDRELIKQYNAVETNSCHIVAHIFYIVGRVQLD